MIGSCLEPFMQAFGVTVQLLNSQSFLSATCCVGWFVVGGSEVTSGTILCLAFVWGIWGCSFFRYLACMEPLDLVWVMSGGTAHFWSIRMVRVSLLVKVRCFKLTGVFLR